mmetsp:Transcript_12571/g.18053  ORF Transcript_12571/g.18053 Transcript_12571/m.18053 type:complete len:101 (-) Transcript_12571:2861-3163(-)
MSKDQIGKIKEAIEAITSAPTVKECRLVEDYDASKVGYPPNLAASSKEYRSYNQLDFAKPSKATLAFMKDADVIRYPAYNSVLEHMQGRPKIYNLLWQFC